GAAGSDEFLRALYSIVCDNSGSLDNVKTQKATRQQLGFSLIDVLITVVIVGILAAVVYPSYQAIMRKNNRADAEAYLADVPQPHVSHRGRCGAPHDRQSKCSAHRVAGKRLVGSIADHYQYGRKRPFRRMVGACDE